MLVSGVLISLVIAILYTIFTTEVMVREEYPTVYAGLANGGCFVSSFGAGQSLGARTAEFRTVVRKPHENLRQCIARALEEDKQNEEKRKSERSQTTEAPKALKRNRKKGTVRSTTSQDCKKQSQTTKKATKKPTKRSTSTKDC